MLYQSEAEKFSYLKLVAGILLLLVVGFKLIRDFNAIVDISFDDEVQYMKYGMDMFDTIRTDWGPSYNLWYKFLSFFEKDAIQLYLLNFKVLVLLFPLSVFVFLYSYRFSFILSFWIAFSLLISTTNILTYPRISHFTVCLLLWALTINRLFITSKPKQYIVVLFAVYVGAFARPELMLSVMILSCVFIYVLIKKYKLREYIFFSLPFIVIMLLMYFYIGTPSSTYKEIDRTYIAFCQHYTIKYIISHKESFNLFIDWIAFSKTQFPGCETFKDIVLQYPLVVIKGFFFNAGMFILLLIKSTVDSFFPYELFPFKPIQFLSYIVFACVLLYVLIKKNIRINIFENIRKHQCLFFILIIYILPSLASSIVFFPRMHYMQLFLPLIVLLMATILESIFKTKYLKLFYLIPIFIIFYIKTPNIIRYNTPAIVSGSCPNQSYKDFVKELNKKDGTHVIFSNIHNLSMMTKGNFSDFEAEYDYDNSKTFKEQMLSKNIDHILVTEFLTNDRRLSKDSTWANFIQNYDGYGFKKKILFKDCPTYLLYKN